MTNISDIWTPEELYDAKYKAGLDAKDYGIDRVSGWEWLARDYLVEHIALTLHASEKERKFSEDYIKLIEERHPTLRKPSLEEIKEYNKTWNKAGNLCSFGNTYDSPSHLDEGHKAFRSTFNLAWKLWAKDPRKE